MTVTSSPQTVAHGIPEALIRQDVENCLESICEPLRWGGGRGGERRRGSQANKGTLEATEDVFTR